MNHFHYKKNPALNPSKGSLDLFQWQSVSETFFLLVSVFAIVGSDVVEVDINKGNKGTGRKLDFVFVTRSIDSSAAIWVFLSILSK